MTTYTIGPGETYETFTALEAAVVLAGDDIVDGGNNTFAETWIPETGGTSGHPIVLRNATIQKYDSTGNDYISLVNITVSGSTGTAIDLSGVNDGFSMSNITLPDTDYNTPIWVDAGDSGLISGGTISQGEQFAFVFIGSGADFVDNTIVEDLTFTGTIGKSYGSGFYLKGTGNIFRRITITNWNMVDTTSQFFRCLQTVDNEFRDNIITTADFRLFNIAGGSGHIIDGNTITDCSEIIVSDGTNVTASNNIINSSNIVFINTGTNFIADTNTVTDAVQFFISTTGTFTLSDNIVTDMTNIPITVSGGSGTISGNTISATSPAAFNGITLSGTTVALSDNTVTSYSNGIITTGAHTITSDGDEVNDSGTDGFSTNGTGTLTAWRSQTSGNGVNSASDASAGDGFTSHDTSELNTYFSLALSNYRTSHGLAGTSTGSIYHNTGINNDVATTDRRAELYMTTTGVFTIKNSIFMNTNAHDLVIYNGVAAHVFDYNCYISTITTPFNDDGAKLTFTQWVALVGNETHSYFIHKNGSSYDWYKGDDPGTKIQTTSYNPVTSEGKLIKNSTNLLLDTGVVIVGVNDGGELDIWGNATDGTPNIGVYQGLGEGGDSQIILNGAANPTINGDVSSYINGIPPSIIINGI